VVLTLCACSSPVAPTPTLDSITIMGSWFNSDPPEILLSATGLYSDGTTRNLTNVVAWQSSNPTVGTISAPGILSILVGNGTTVITAMYQGKVGSLKLEWPL
jgi:hypothetical protein